MSYKPDESTLVAYIYGELSHNEKEKLEKYLREHPEVQKEIDALKDVRSIMGKLSDQEVSEPLIVLDGQGGSGRHLMWQILKPVIGIAATLLIVFLVAIVTKMNITSTDNGLSLTFGVQPEQTTGKDTEGQDLASFNELVDQKINNNNRELSDQISSVEKNLNDQLEMNRTTFHSLSSKEDSPSGIDEETMKQLLENYKHENLQLMANLIELSRQQQDDEMEELLVNFAEYLKNQREQDLLMIRTGITDLKEETDLKMARIINSVNTQNN